MGSKAKENKKRKTAPTEDSVASAIVVTPEKKSHFKLPSKNTEHKKFVPDEIEFHLLKNARYGVITCKKGQKPEEDAFWGYVVSLAKDFDGHYIVS